MLRAVGRAGAGAGEGGRRVGSEEEDREVEEQGALGCRCDGLRASMWGTSCVSGNLAAQHVLGNDAPTLCSAGRPCAGARAGRGEPLPHQLSRAMLCRFPVAQLLYVANMHLEGHPYRPNDRISQVRGGRKGVQAHTREARCHLRHLSLDVCVPLPWLLPWVLGRSASANAGTVSLSGSSSDVP